MYKINIFIYRPTVWYCTRGRKRSAIHFKHHTWHRSQLFMFKGLLLQWQQRWYRLWWQFHLGGTATGLSASVSFHIISWLPLLGITFTETLNYIGSLKSHWVNKKCRGLVILIACINMIPVNNCSCHVSKTESASCNKININPRVFNTSDNHVSLWISISYDEE